MRLTLSFNYLCLGLLLCAGCSTYRTYCHLDGDTHVQQSGHTVYVHLSPDNTEGYVGANMWAKSFVLEFQGTVESVHGSYRYGNGDFEQVRSLEVAFIGKNRAVLIPTANVGYFANFYQKVQCMKEGRYVLDVVYRMNGRDCEYHGALIYNRKGDWGVQWMTGTSNQTSSNHARRLDCGCFSTAITQINFKISSIPCPPVESTA